MSLASCVCLCVCTRARTRARGLCVAPSRRSFAFSRPAGHHFSESACMPAGTSPLDANEPPEPRAPRFFLSRLREPRLLPEPEPPPPFTPAEAGVATRPLPLAGAPLAAGPPPFCANMLPAALPSMLMPEDEFGAGAPLPCEWLFIMDCANAWKSKLGGATAPRAGTPLAKPGGMFCGAAPGCACADELKGDGPPSVRLPPAPYGAAGGVSGAPVGDVPSPSPRANANLERDPSPPSGSPFIAVLVGGPRIGMLPRRPEDVADSACPCCVKGCAAGTWESDAPLGASRGNELVTQSSMLKLLPMPPGLGCPPPPTG